MGKVKVRELKHIWVFDEGDNPVNAEAVTTQDKIKHKYYIYGYDADGNRVKERVMHVSPANKRKHFRQYPIKITKTQDNEEIKRVVDTKVHIETILHRLAKKVFIEGKVQWVNLPDCVVQTSTGVTLKRDNGIFRIHKVETEKRITVPVLETDVVFDVLAYNNVKNTYLGIEIYVTHHSDSVKMEKLRYLNYDVIEIDISSLNNEVSLVDPELELKLIGMIQSGLNAIYIREHVGDMLMDAINNRIIVIDEVEKTRYDGDGAFIFFKDKYKDKLPKCKYMQSWDGNSESYNKDRSISENQCLSCERCMGTSVSIYGKVVLFCNQSDLTSREIQNSIMHMIKLG